MVNNQNTGITVMLEKVYNPEISPYPSELSDYFEDSAPKTKVLSCIKDINDLVSIDRENDEAFFSAGGFTFQVISMSLKIIQDSMPPQFTLDVIKLFHLDIYLRLDRVIKTLTKLSKK